MSQVYDAGQSPFADALSRLLPAFEAYYQLNLETPLPPFLAEAEFRMHNENYMLIRAAKITEFDSRELVFFAGEEVLTAERFQELDRLSWETGLSRAEVKENHRNTDVALILLTNHLTEEAEALIRRTRHYKSYRFGLLGFSAGRVLACDLGSGRIVHNRMGESLKKTVAGALFQK